MTRLPQDLAPVAAARLAAATAEMGEPGLEWPGRLVAALVAILERDAPGAFAVFEMPDNIRKVDIGTNDGAIVVHYRGSKYTVKDDANPVFAQRRFDVDVHVLARGLVGRSGAPNVIEIVRRLLQARRVEGSGPLAPVEDGFANEENCVWDYVIQFRGQIPAVGGNWPHREDRS